MGLFLGSERGRPLDPVCRGPGKIGDFVPIGVAHSCGLDWHSRTMMDLFCYVLFTELKWTHGFVFVRFLGAVMSIWFLCLFLLSLPVAPS